MATSHSDTKDELKTKNKSSETEDGSPNVKKISSSKRHVEETKKHFLGVNEESKKVKKNSFHWSWTDECTILENFYEFAGKNGSYSKNFYHFVRNKLTVEVSNSQLSDKVYRLRKRFLKDEADMEETKVKFSESNYEKLFEMSKQIWGSNYQNGGDNTSPSRLTQLKSEEVDRFYWKLFENFFAEVKFDMNCIPSHVLEDVKKDWEDMKSAKNEYELKNTQLLVEISDIRCSQNYKRRVKDNQDFKQIG